MSVAHRAGWSWSTRRTRRATCPHVCPLRDAFASPAAYETAMDGVFPMTLRLARMPEAPPLEDAFRRHERIAFQFSGGRDSMAAAWLLRPYWDRMDLLPPGHGDQFPETRRRGGCDFREDLGKPIVRIQATCTRSAMPSTGCPATWCRWTTRRSAGW
jgi:hypothetical protein